MEKLFLLLVMAVVMASVATAKEHKHKGNGSRSAPPGAQLDPINEVADLETGADQHASLRGHGPLATRNGFQLPFPVPGPNSLLDKSAPDLQFGLALTIPFVSLATEKLLHSFGPGGGPGNLRSFRSWSDIASLLKLNVGGLVLAAVVGVAALFFLPSIFQNRGILKGFGSNLFDNLVHGGVGGGLNKHFGYGQYEHAGGYGGGYDSPGSGFNKYGYGRKGSRDLKEANGTAASVWQTITATVQQNLPELSACSLYAMCLQGRAGNEEPAAKEAKVAGLGELNEYAGRLEEAFVLGRNGTADCATAYGGGCARIPKFIDSVGRYIFGD